ncbi:MAG: helix-turn-helix domain-containing protein, partial [Solirubrobacterales bacterium]|nr:helix-turn-helix domain-containing protein [Solirubrobacterales bacterium]
MRAAREARGLSLEQLAAETRIPQRQLVTIEAGNFASLPGRTYAIGFARTYARMVGLDPEIIAGEVRAELDAQDFDPRHRPASFEPGDPARLPSRLLGWFSVLAVILVLAGLFVFYRTFFTPAAELPSLLDQQKAEQKAHAAAQPKAGVVPGQPMAPASGPVVFTALADAVWVKFYDGSGKQLMQKEMAKGESYTVPADAQGPKLWTGRPEALAITIGG